MSTSAAIQAHLDAVKGKPVDTDALAQRAVELAGELLKEANLRRTPADKRQGEKMSRMMDDPQGKAFTVALADRAFRSNNPAVVTEQLRHLLKGYGVPKYLFPQEKFLMSLGAFGSHFLPGLVASQVTKTLREESKSVILPGETAALTGHVQKRKKDNIRLNLNKLGEAILGEEEAKHRFDLNLELLSSENADYISVKISSVFSRCNAISFEWTVGEIQKRLREFYRVAIKNPVTLADGTKRPKFVNLDMEEYRDLEMTIAAFTRTLDEPEFMQLRAGIVLQAYLPDARGALAYLTEWSKKRVAAGGASIKVRIVKGANLAMETAEAALKDWEVAPYITKADVDANYKGCVRFALTKENAAAVNIGVASHNLFDVAFALLLRSANGLEAQVEIEMLEGMANHQAGAVRDAAGGLLLYAPVVTADDFQSAIAYLVRRLDENTSEQNFLHDLFGLEVGSATWEKQKKMFLAAVKHSATVSTEPRRKQNRLTKKHTAADFAGKYHASADTDWVLRPNRDWVEAEIAKLKSAAPAEIPLTIGGEEMKPNFDGVGTDPSRPGVAAYKYAVADEEIVEACLESAVEAQTEWAAKSVAERRAILIAVAAELENSRGELVATMILDGGKTAYEADAELSEAVDFANFYARAFDDKDTYAGVSGKALGVVTVAPPWNFPVAIPAGGVLAALMAGCSVIFKPAPEAVLCGRRMMEALWRAGVPKEAAQFIVAPDNHIGKQLIVDSRVAAVVLTGATATADMFLGWKPSLRLFAETGGKNALIITANADRDQAIKDLVKSAFGHAGQKCSAASLAILEAEIYDDPVFRKQLRDAAASLIVGSPWDLQTEMPPVIRTPEEETLKRALTENDAGESWLLEPKNVAGNPNLWTPGIKLGVHADSWFRATECFGPVLGLVRADNLTHAIGIANGSSYGLTGGIHTLDEREIAVWKEQVEVGNAYVNRPITGAIVNRQPFGGWKRSSYGPGAKAGGSNYVAQFMTWTNDAKLPASHLAPEPAATALMDSLVAFTGKEQTQVLHAAASHYAETRAKEFSKDHDPAALYCESNVFRYRKDKAVLIRYAKADTKLDLALALLAAATAGVTATVSAEPGATVPSLAGVKVVLETEADLAKRLDSHGFEGIFRSFSKIGDELLRAVNHEHLRPVPGRAVANGRLELRGYYREQAMSHCTHRYGTIITPPKNA